jgi:hypothetical protein
MWTSGLGLLTQNDVGWGGSFVDFDNDGDSDLFVVNGSAFTLGGTRSLLLENDGTGHFTDAGARGGRFFATPIDGRGSAVLDYDNDGRLDLLVTTLANRTILLRNRCDNGNHWLKLQLEATAGNRTGYGALVTLTSGVRSWRGEALCPTGFLMQGDGRLHFGLGPVSQVDKLEIEWPGGAKQVLTAVSADQILQLREPTN